MTSEQTQQDFDHYAEDYKRLLSEATGDSPETIDFYARQKLRALRRMLRRAGPIQTILDYGCGIGLSLPSLREFFPNSDLWGTDPSERSLALAHSQHENLNVRTINFQQLNSKDCGVRFDLIYVSCVFHHINHCDHVSTLSNLRRLTKPDGLICIVEHNPRNPITRKIVRDCPFDEGVTLIPETVMQERLAEAGWTGIRCRYISFVPASLQRLGRLERLFSWFPIGGQYILCAHAS